MTSPRWPRWALPGVPALLLLAALGPGLSLAQGGGAVVRLVALEAGYGPEEWKDEPAVGGVAGSLPLPPGAGSRLGVYSNPYADGTPHRGPLPWLGYNATATVDVEAGGTTVPADVYVAARLRTSAGDVPAKLVRLGPARFAAQFDLDGEQGDAGIPAAGPGPARLVVEVYEDAADPTVADRRLATAEFPLGVVPASLDLGGLLLEEGALGFGDVGAGNGTLLHARSVPPGEAFTLVASLGAPESPAAVVAWHLGRTVVLAEGRTDAQGRFAATVEARGLVGGNRSGLAVVEAHLDGSAGRVASAPLVVVVGSRGTRVSGFDYEGRGLPGSAGDDLLVRVRDLQPDDEAPARGVLHLVEGGGTSFAEVPFEPTSFAPRAQERIARVPASLLPSGLAEYRVLARFDLADGRLHSLAHAVRGLTAVADESRAAPFEPGNLTLRVRNLNSNFDDAVDEGLGALIHLNVTGLPGGGTFSTAVDVAEQGEQRVDLPFRGDTGTYDARVTATHGELRFERVVSVVVQGVASSVLPAGEGAAVLGALAAAALLQRARTRA